MQLFLQLPPGSAFFVLIFWCRIVEGQRPEARASVRFPGRALQVIIQVRPRSAVVRRVPYLLAEHRHAQGIPPGDAVTGARAHCLAPIPWCPAQGSLAGSASAHRARQATRPERGGDHHMSNGESSPYARPLEVRPSPMHTRARTHNSSEYDMVAAPRRSVARFKMGIG